MTDEIRDTPHPQEQNQTAEKYLERIGAVDRENLRILTKSFADTLQTEGVKGFIFAVGGTTISQNPQERKDIDLLMGIEQELGDTSKLAPVGKYRLEFDGWKSLALKSLKPLIEKGVIIGYIEDPIYPDKERESLPANDGKLVLNFRAGKTVEVLCHHGTEISKTAIQLFSNRNQAQAA